MKKKKDIVDKITEKPIIMQYLQELVSASLENRKPEVVPTELSFADLLDIGKRNQIPFLIESALIKLSDDENMIKDMRSSVQCSMYKTLAQVMEAKKISEAFEKAGIRHQMLKGTVMKQVYPRPETREMGDIDCMVYESNFDKADVIMQELGYTKIQDIMHHVIYRKAPFIIFEMHWDLYEKTVDKEQYLYYKDNFRAVLKEGYQYTYEFSKEDFYVYMISHMAKHFYEEGCGIRNLLDIYVYQEKYGKELNKDILSAELEKCGLTTFEKHARKLAYIWLKEEQSTEFYNFMFKYMVDCGIYGKAENGIWGQLAKQENCSDNGKKANFLFPPMEYMKQEYPWLEGKGYLLPAAWIKRAMTGILDEEARKRFGKMMNQSEVLDYKNMYLKLNLNFNK